MTGRYCYCPMTSRRLCQRITLADRIRRWKIERQKRKNAPDMYQVIGYRQPVFPGK